MMNEENIKTLKQWIDDASSIVFFGGAGVSTESGVPDFRSKDGLYNQHDIRFDMYQPEYLLSHSCLRDNPKVFFEFYRQKMDARNVKPNAAHYYLAKLEAEGKLSGIVTQNIDGLHQKAGSSRVYEIHGTTQKNYCDRCHKTYDANYIYNSKESIPKCDCGGTIRCAVTLYEEQLPEDAVEGAIRIISNSDLLIIGGTSLTVYPAASYIHYYTGKRIVVINKDPIDIHINTDSVLMINDKIGEVFKAVEELSK